VLGAIKIGGFVVCASAFADAFHASTLLLFALSGATDVADCARASGAPSRFDHNKMAIVGLFMAILKWVEG
jgi:hypothetical protein